MATLLGRPVHPLIYANVQSFGISCCSHSTSEWGEKCNLSDFDHGIIVDPKWPVWVFQYILGCAYPMESWLYTKWCKKSKTFSEQQFCRQKCLVYKRGQKRLARQVWAKSEATVTQITTLSNSGEQTVWHVEPYNNRRLPWALPPLVTNKNQRLQWTKTHRDWTSEDYLVWLYTVSANI